MEYLQVNNGFEEGIKLQKQVLVLVKALIEERLEKPFEESNRFDIFTLRTMLTVENVEEFLEKHSDIWNPIYEAVKEDGAQSAYAFILLMKKLNVLFQTVNGKHFVQFDYSKMIGRWWNVLTENSRGIVYSYPELEVLSVPFHKFYNLNERPHTLFQNLNLHQKHYLFEKLDGTMLHAFEYEGELYVGTRGAIAGYEFNEVGKKLILNEANTEEVLSLIRSGHTPIFELLLPLENELAQVIEYQQDEIRLIAVRNRKDGSYIHPTEIPGLSEKLGVKSAVFYENMHLTDAMEQQKEIKNMEGWVIYFEDGTFLKVKGEDYLRLLQPKEFGMKFEKKPLALAKTVFELMKENKLDDMLSITSNDKVRGEMERLQDEIQGIVDGFHRRARELYDTYYHGDRKVFANAVRQKESNIYIQAVAFTYLSGKVAELKWTHIEPLLTIVKK